jgi:hypothetical protein
MNTTLGYASEIKGVLASIQARKNNMKENEHDPLSDEVWVLEFLKRHPDEFFSDAEISRHVDSEAGFVEEANRARSALSRLLALHVVETDGSRNYRFKRSRTITVKDSAKKFISPQIKIMLRQNGQNIDPKRYS